MNTLIAHDRSWIEMKIWLHDLSLFQLENLIKENEKERRKKKEREPDNLPFPESELHLFWYFKQILLVSQKDSVLVSDSRALDHPWNVKRQLGQYSISFCWFIFYWRRLELPSKSLHHWHREYHTPHRSWTHLLHCHLRLVQGFPHLLKDLGHLQGLLQPLELL